MRLPLRPKNIVSGLRQSSDFLGCRGWLAAVLALAAPLSGCQSGHADAVPDLAPSLDAAAPPSLIPGQGTNTVPLLATLAQLRAAYGKPSCLPDPSCLSPQGYGLLNFPLYGISAFVGTEQAQIDDRAIVLALWTQDAAVAAPVRVGSTRDELVQTLGAADSEYGPVLSYAKGLSVTLDKSSRVASVAVFPSYLHQKSPPEMLPAITVTAPAAPTVTWPRYQLDGEEIDVVDMHLHPGSYGALGPGIAQTLPATVPPFLLPILPAFTNAVSTPYTPGVGMVAQARRFGFQHLGYLAVWAPATVGWYTNTDLTQLLYDVRNVQRPDGRPLAFGFASIFWDNLMDGTLIAQRCAALETYLNEQGERIIGIKLAHPHQGVPLASAATDCVYELAGRYKKPVALHTGKTPTPGSLDQPEAYDPQFLEEKIKAFPNTTFILMHVGQGDLRATNHALALAATYRNVALELSALGRPTVLNERGELAMTMEPQFPYVLAEAKRRSVVDRLIWASDGPQSPGFPASYRDRMVTELKKQLFTKEQIKSILAGNFYRIFNL